jgi:nitrite reductase/ring-hydroxylating ferredoxin subunit
VRRRSFLDWLVGIFGTALAALVAYPVARFLVPPKIPEATTRRVLAAQPDELAPGACKIFPFGSRAGILIRDADGGYRALSAECTHLACTVQYRKESHSIWCACHNGVYDVEGRNVSGPPPRPLEKWVVHVTAEGVVVELGARA